MSNITRGDFAAASTDVTASKKIAAEVARRQQTNPRFSFEDLRREVGATSPGENGSDSRITKEDFEKAFLDPNRARKIDAEVRLRRQANPKFTVEDLRREVLKPAPPVASRQAAPVVSIAARAGRATSRAQHLKSSVDNAASHRPGEKRSDAQRLAYCELLKIGKTLGVPYAGSRLVGAIADVMNGRPDALVELDSAASELKALIDSCATQLNDGPEAA